MSALNSGTVRRVMDRPLVLLVIGAAMVIAATLGARALVDVIPYSPNSPMAAAKGLLMALASIISYKVFKRWVERAPDRELASTGAAIELALGLVFGLVLILLAAGFVYILGGLRVSGVRGLGEFWPMLSMAVFSGPFEETLFRGIGLRLLEQRVGTGLALALTSAFFGFAHLENPGASLFAALALAFEAGILLGAAYLLTRRLWLAIGIHSAWNFTEGWVLSSPVSGGRQPLGLLNTQWVGPDWLTGGAFGLETSVPAAGVATAAGLAMLWLAYRRGSFIPPHWRRHTKL
jgi:membrane protease YdiL (CAAX protease family)